MNSSREKLVLVVALSAVALMAAGVVFFRFTSDDATLGPGATYDLSTYVKARSVGQWRMVSQELALQPAYSLAVDGAGRVAVGGLGEIVLCPVAVWRDEAVKAPFEIVPVPALFGERSLGRVLSLAFDADGALFVGQTDGIALWQPDSRQQRTWVKFLDRPGCSIVNIVVTDDMIFAADAASRTVLCLDRDGNVVRTIDGRDGSGGEPDSVGFVLPSPHWAMAMGADGLLRIANPGRRRVEAWTVDGHREFVWGQGGPGVGQFSGCCNPAALAVLDDGRIVTAEKGDLLTVTVFEPDGPQAGTAGQVSCVIAGPDRFVTEDGAVAVAALPDGTVLVLQTPGGVLSVFEPPRAASVPPVSGEESP